MAELSDDNSLSGSIAAMEQVIVARVQHGDDSDDEDRMIRAIQRRAGSQLI